MRDGQDKIGIWTMLEESLEYVFSDSKLDCSGTELSSLEQLH